jgi:hypothetical protein
MNVVQVGQYGYGRDDNCDLEEDAERLRQSGKWLQSHRFSFSLNNGGEKNGTSLIIGDFSRVAPVLVTNRPARYNLLGLRPAGLPFDLFLPKNGPVPTQRVNAPIAV